MSNIRITGDGPKITATGSGSTVLVEISTGQHDPGSFSGVHNDLTGRSTTGAHPISAITGLQEALDNAGGGGGGGAVDSVDGRTGTVTLSDLYEAAGAAQAVADTLGTAATKDVGTTAGTVAAGDDSRLSDARTPVSHNHAASEVTSGTLDIARIPTGTTSTTVPLGNDSRFTDSRTPTAHASSHAVAGSDPVTLAQSQVTNLTTDLAGKAASSHNHAGADITSGTVGTARLGSGSATSSTFLRGDQTWATPSGIADPGGSNDDFLQRKSGAWSARTIAQVKTDLGLTPIPGITGWYADGVYSGLQGTMHSNIGGGGSAMTPGADLLWLWRIMPVETIDVDGAYFVISTSGTSGALARVGIYAASSSTTEPTGAPLCDTTGLAVTDAGGSDVVGSFTAVRLTAWTPYWGFMLTNNATFAPRFLSNAANTVQSNRLDTGQVTGSSHTMRRVSATYGTPPTNPSAPFTTASSAGPGVLWKTRRV